MRAVRKPALQFGVQLPSRLVPSYLVSTFECQPRARGAGCRNNHNSDACNAITCNTDIRNATDISNADIHYTADVLLQIATASRGGPSSACACEKPFSCVWSFADEPERTSVYSSAVCSKAVACNALQKQMREQARVLSGLRER